jgi:uncharacterized protein YgiB involved in biofilm formation
MKRTQNIHLDRFKKKQTGEAAPAMMIAGLVIMTGVFLIPKLFTSSNKTDSESYHTKSNYTGACCKSATVTYPDMHSCAPINSDGYNQNTACKVSVLKGDNLETFNVYQGQCQDGSAGECKTVNNNGFNWSVPAGMFLLASMANRGPTIVNQSSSYNGGVAPKNNTSYKNHNYSVTKSKAPAPMKKATIARTKSRGGFGSTASARSSWGSHRSSWGG